MFLFEVLQPLAPELFWILCAAFIIAFLLAFSVGANDVSNSFGTSVGSRVLTVTQACILASIFEMAGATLLGYSVCDTFRRKMYDVQLYEGSQKELMLGALACLVGSSIWNLTATALKMPISGTHSIVGATIGFSVVLRGWDSIRWMDMLRIVASWFASPLLSGCMSSIIYILISKTIISKVDPLKYGLKALPLFYGATIFINVASIVIDGPEVLGLNTLPWYAGLFIALVCASVAICCVAMLLVPKLKREILGEIISSKQTAPVGLSVMKPKFPPPPPHSQTSPESPATADGQAKEAVGYDNVTFKPDLETAAAADDAADDAKPNTAPESKRKRRPPPKPMRQLDPEQLATEQQHSSSPYDHEDTGKPAGPQHPKPPIAPKPIHLRRQMATKQPQLQLDEIDLRPGTPGDVEAGAYQPPPPFKAEDAQSLYTFSGERYEVAKLFSSLQILTACFASFAHGTNDVSNAVAPLIPIWNIYTTGEERIEYQTQVFILAFGSIGICTGLWAWGRAVMATISGGLTKITPSKGFSVELGAAISVLLATKMGLPISTTHCKVGSLVIVGFVSSKYLSQDNLLNRAQQQHVEDGGKQDLQIAGGDSGGPASDAVDWKLFGNIAITWISTVPLAGAASAIVMYILRWLAL